MVLEHRNNYYPATNTKKFNKTIDAGRCIIDAQLSRQTRACQSCLVLSIARAVQSRQAKSTPQSNNSREHATLQLQRLFDLAGRGTEKKTG